MNSGNDATSKRRAALVERPHDLGKRIGLYRVIRLDARERFGEFAVILAYLVMVEDEDRRAVPLGYPLQFFEALWKALLTFSCLSPSLTA